MSIENKTEYLKLSNMESNKITKESIQVALISLMANKKLENITITEIVKKAGVSRTSFYRNYKDKEDVLLDFYENLLNTIIEITNRDKYKNDWYLFFLDLFKYSRKEEKNLKVLIKANLLNSNIINIEKIINNSFNPNSREMSYKILAINASVYVIFLEWIMSGMKESNEFMANICCNIMKNII